MPMLYGEASYAFIRLQEEIIKNTDDHSIFAWVNQPGSYFSHGLLADTPAGFSSSGNIVQIKDSAAHPFAFTNKGIQLRLRTRKLENSKLFLALLNCYVGLPETRVGLYLAKQSVGADLFERVRSYDLGRIRKSERPRHKEMNLFVKQGRPHIFAPLTYTYYVTTSGLIEAGFSLRESYPTGIQPDDLTKPVLLVSEGNSFYPLTHIRGFRFMGPEGHGFIIFLKSSSEGTYDRSKFLVAILDLNEFSSLVLQLLLPKGKHSLEAICRFLEISKSGLISIPFGSKTLAASGTRVVAKCDNQEDLDEWEKGENRTNQLACSERRIEALRAFRSGRSIVPGRIKC